jgi:class 3 adenylate cyclase
VAVVLTLLTLFVFRRRIELARREQVRLELKIAERTREIRQQKTQIEEQNKLIEEEKNKVIEQQALLQIEKDKTEKWLSNTLPAEAVIELKRSGKVQANSFKVVSVLFTDVVGFTKISEKMSANRLVNKLDVLFRKFDEVIDVNNLEKIKTIGDAYMCAGGKVKFDAIANHEDYWEIRLGINTGPVTAGIIGNLRLAYDVWGSTVNLAQRMEMLGEPGKVTITGSTFKYIEPYFEYEFKGKVQSKAKTMIDMYVVNRIKPELSVNGEGLIPNSRFEEIKKLHHYSNIKYYKTEHHVLKILEKGLSDKLYYHSIHHTKDVVKAVERIALLEGVTDEGLFLLKTAAILHDAGFIERYEHNEEIGARMATELLPKYGYTEQHIKTIVELIHVTEIPHKPINKLQEIICDADLDYLGREDFEEIADRLRIELREMGKIDSDRKWDEIQIKFLENHQYFTQTAIELRQKKKEENIQMVKDRLARNDYKD